MIEHPERVDQFKQDIAAMQVRDPAAGRDRLFLRGGVTLMIIGVIVAIVGYVLSHQTKIALEQTDAMIVALIGIALTIEVPRCSCVVRSPDSSGSGWPA